MYDGNGHFNIQRAITLKVGKKSYGSYVLHAVFCQEIS